ncbi:MAG: ABC transporter permease [Bacteroidia bacterium]|nr:ABC transporter permease [Bacteroidia bacterium]
MNIKNNFLISVRHLKADKTNTIISISGLILGLGIVVVVLIFVLNEFGYNSSYQNRKQIYRVLNNNRDDNNNWANTPFIVGETLVGQFAEVEQIAHQYNISNVEIKKDNDFISEREMLCTESSFFNIFDVAILQGSLRDFDRAERKILLSKKLSEKYFHLENPVGKILTLRYLGNEYPMEIAAVYEDFPQNSTIKASIIAGTDFGFKHLVSNMVSTGEKPGMQKLRESWEGGLFFTNYLLLKKGTSVGDFERKLQRLGVEHSTDNNKLSLSLQPLTEIYFGSGKIVDNNRGDQGNLPMIYILTIVGLLILLIACINYLNLAAAQAMTQSKGFTVRKVCGASRKSLIMQMIFESSLISFIALPFALFLAHFSLPFISELLGKSYSLTLSNRFFLGFVILLLITVSTGAISGGLVSLKITSFSVVEILKGQDVTFGNKHSMRKAMVILQIVIFITLVATMILVQKQVHYAFTKDIGIGKEGLVRITLGDHNYKLFKQEIRKNPNILTTS